MPFTSLQRPDGRWHCIYNTAVRIYNTAVHRSGEGSVTSGEEDKNQQVRYYSKSRQDKENIVKTHHFWGRLISFVMIATVATTVMAQDCTRITYISAGSAEVEQVHDLKWVEEFNNSQDEICVDYELVSWSDLILKVSAYLAAGTAPDVVWYGPTSLNEWAKIGILEPLGERLGDGVETYLPHLIGPNSDVIFDGEMYGAPFTQVARGFIVRRDWLEEAGINPEDIRTWEDFKEAAAAITEQAPERYGLAIALAEDRLAASALDNYFAPGFGLKNVVDFREEKRAAYIDMLSTVQSLAPYMPPAQAAWTHRDTIISYVNGTVGMTPQGSYFQGDLAPLAPELSTPEVSAVVPIPAGEYQDVPTSSAYTVGYVMMKGSEHKEEAAEFINYMIQSRVVQEWPMNMSPKMDVTVDDRVEVLGEQIRWWEEEWYDLLGSAELVAIPKYAPSGEVNSVIAEVLGNLLAERVTPEEAYEQLKNRIEPILLE